MSFDVYLQGIFDITFIKTKSTCIMNQFLNKVFLEFTYAVVMMNFIVIY